MALIQQRLTMLPWTIAYLFQWYLTVKANVGIHTSPIPTSEEENKEREGEE